MTFHQFSTYLDRIEKLSSRLEMTDVLADLFSKSSIEEVSAMCYLMTGRVAPLFISAEFNVAEKTIVAVLEGVGVSKGSRIDVRKKYAKLGDLGRVTEELIEKNSSRKSEKKLRLLTVYDLLWEIVVVSGQGSVETRTRKIAGLLLEVSPLEGRFLTRILLQQMRLGVSDKTVLDALSVMKRGDKGDRAEIERAYGVCTDLGHIASIYIKKGLQGLGAIEVTPGVPVFSMLPQRESDAEAVMKRIPQAIVQPKFDGIRCQIHVGVVEEKSYSDRVWFNGWQTVALSDSELGTLFDDEKKDDSVRLFSRNLEDMTDMFPEIVKEAKRLKVKSAVFDAEVIGINDTTGEFVPFQETMIRKRKYSVAKAADTVPVRAYIFDVLFLDGQDLTFEENGKRINRISNIVRGCDLMVDTSSTLAESANDLQKIFNENVEKGLEGVMIKDPGSNYRAGFRGFEWIKLKRAAHAELADTIDVVILGYYFGRGRQADFGIGAILGGVYDKEQDEYVSVAKIGTGVTDEQWKMIKEDLDELKIDERPKGVNVDKQLHPDQWVDPKIVSVVEADEITRSPIHTAGRDKEGVGYALRFPRLKQWNRDKLPEDATSVEELVGMVHR